MVKAKNMSPQEFRAYVDKYKEEMEEKYRKQGGGVLGGEWIWRDPKGKQHQEDGEKAMGVMVMMLWDLGEYVLVFARSGLSDDEFVIVLTPGDRALGRSFADFGWARRGEERDVDTLT
ncbi:hypothetical protein LTR47_003018 [Exophiala xenobiotica]|nr:hypothetical protein LTR41_009835 [Exophiala xenobiotica]KAK5226003.1 hypothetical protein LTR72_003906 [Exophiala xenobiotica]KAK5236292.1 hypothetical protein LTR47_003018 [Exophiala xenobiotica]KAK5255285.1 hypothetical protein LTS06_000698 [Exophiala xenobiotica]KAK5298823.1 hypothetical protein LTR14_002674 [Exophiala xenobiotica]